MIQYAGITLLKDDNGQPETLHIDLRRHGTELAAFLSTHGLTNENDDLQRSVGPEKIVSNHLTVKTEQRQIRYFPEIRQQLQEKIALIFQNEFTRPSRLDAATYQSKVIDGIARNLTVLKRKRETAYPELPECNLKDAFLLHFHLLQSPNILWNVYYTIHDKGTILIRYVTYT